MNPKELRDHLKEAIPELWTEMNQIAKSWSQDIIKNLERRSGQPAAFPKTFTDPLLGPVELFEWEISILDSPLMQRLRGVRQLGMAHTAYPSATHDRFSHCIGVVE